MYVSGRVDIFDMVDIDLLLSFFCAEHDWFVKLGYTGKSEPMFYNYLKPLTSLDEGLYALTYEEDVRCLGTPVRSFKLIEVDIEHGITTLDSYLRVPRFMATLEEITDEAGSIAANRTEKCSLSIPIVAEVSTEVPIVEEVGTQEFSVEDVVVEDYVSSGEDGEDAEQGTDDDVDEDFLEEKKFTTPKEVKDIVYLHSIESRRNLKLYKNDGVRIRARGNGKVLVFTMSQGQVLVAVGLDSNNGIYPLAYALVEAESNEFMVLWFLASGIILAIKMFTQVRTRILLANTYMKHAAGMVVDKHTRYWEKSTCPTTLLPPKHHVQVGRPRKKRKRSKHEYESFVKDGGNNVEASGSTSRQAQQTEPAVGQDGSGGSGGGDVIGLSVGQGGLGDVGGAGGAGVASQDSSYSRWTKRRVQIKRISPQKRTLTQPSSQPSTSSQVPASETRNADRREIGDGIPTQSSAAGGASEWSFMYSNLSVSGEGLGGGGYLTDYVSVFGGTDDVVGCGGGTLAEGDVGEFKSRKVGMIWSFGFLGVCKGTKILFVCEYGLTSEWDSEDLTELLERESDEFRNYVDRISFCGACVGWVRFDFLWIDGIKACYIVGATLVFNCCKYVYHGDDLSLMLNSVGFYQFDDLEYLLDQVKEEIQQAF
ncbi:hypothetical protein Tco_0715672 [Tanacetum coccineum]